VTLLKQAKRTTTSLFTVMTYVSNNMVVKIAAYLCVSDDCSL